MYQLVPRTTSDTCPLTVLTLFTASLFLSLKFRDFLPSSFPNEPFFSLTSLLFFLYSFLCLTFFSSLIYHFNATFRHSLSFITVFHHLSSSHKSSFSLSTPSFRNLLCSYSILNLFSQILSSYSTFIFTSYILLHPFFMKFTIPQYFLFFLPHKSPFPAFTPFTTTKRCSGSLLAAALHIVTSISEPFLVYHCSSFTLIHLYL